MICINNVGWILGLVAKSQRRKGRISEVRGFCKERTQEMCLPLNGMFWWNLTHFLKSFLKCLVQKTYSIVVWGIVSCRFQSQPTLRYVTALWPTGNRMHGSCSDATILLTAAAASGRCVLSSDGSSRDVCGATSWINFNWLLFRARE